MRSNALGSLLVQLAKRAAFHQLRTVEQLGYMVFLTTWTNETVRSVVRALCNVPCARPPGKLLLAAASQRVCLSSLHVPGKEC